MLLGVLDAKVGGGEFVTHAFQPFHQFRRAFAQVADAVGVHVVQRAALGDHVQNVVVHLVDGFHLGGHHAGFRAVEARGGQKAAAAHNRLLFHQNDVRAGLRRRQRGGEARDAAAHDHHVGAHVLKLLGGSALHRALEGLGVTARLLHAVLHSRQNGVGGVGRARDRVHRQRLVFHDRGGNPLDGRLADACGFRMLRHAHGGDGAIVKIHLNGHGAVVAVSACGIGPGGVALGHGGRGQAQRQHHAQNDRQNLLHGIFLLLSLRVPILHPHCAPSNDLRVKRK